MTAADSLGLMSNDPGAAPYHPAASGAKVGLVEVVMLMCHSGHKHDFDLGTQGPQGKGMSMNNGLFKRSGIRYEVACDVIGAVIAHYSEAVAIERNKANPDQALIAAAEAAKKALRDTRDALDTRDVAGIEAAIATFGPQARALYQ